MLHLGLTIAMTYEYETLTIWSHGTMCHRIGIDGTCLYNSNDVWDADDK